MLWEDFLSQSKDDFDSSKNLMKNKSFGTSAYLLQQSVEKRVKAMVMKIDKQADPQSFGHLPLPKLLNDLRAEIKKIIRKKSNKSNQNMFHQLNTVILPKLNDYLQWAKSDGLNIMWKNSLGIKLTDAENTEIIERNKMVVKKVPKMQTLFEQFHTELQQSKSDSLPESLLPLIELNISYDKSSKETKIADHKECEINICDPIMPIIKFLYTLPQDKKLSDTFYILVLNFALAIFTDIIISTFPHETIGRYPRMVDGKSSVDLYEKHVDALDLLSKKIEKRFKDIEFIFEYE